MNREIKYWKNRSGIEELQFYQEENYLVIHIRIINDEDEELDNIFTLNKSELQQFISDLMHIENKLKEVSNG